MQGISQDSRVWPQTKGFSGGRKGPVLHRFTRIIKEIYPKEKAQAGKTPRLRCVASLVYLPGGLLLAVGGGENARRPARRANRAKGEAITAALKTESVRLVFRLGAGQREHHNGGFGATNGDHVRVAFVDRVLSGRHSSLARGECKRYIYAKRGEIGPGSGQSREGRTDSGDSHQRREFVSHSCCSFQMDVSCSPGVNPAIDLLPPRTLQAEVPRGEI